MAPVGYPNLLVEQAISMRALNVRAYYMRRVKRVAVAMGELM